MRNTFSNRIALGAAAALVSLALLAGACGDDGGGAVATPDEPAAPASAAGGSVPSTGSVAPDTFLTHEGARYRLVELFQSDARTATPPASPPSVYRWTPDL